MGFSASPMRETVICSEVLPPYKSCYSLSVTTDRSCWVMINGQKVSRMLLGEPLICFRAS